MIEAVYTVTEKQFVEAAKAYCKPQAEKYPGHWAIQIVTGIFFATALIGEQFNPLWLTCCSLGSLAALLITQLWRKRAIPAYQASAYAEFNEEVSVRFDEEGFHSDKPGLSASWIAWAAFSGWLETENMFILGMKLSWIPIPKSAFDQIQQNELRTLFRSHVAARS